MKAKELTSKIAYQSRVLKLPVVRSCASELAQRARDQGWSHEEYLAAVLERQLIDREAKSLHNRMVRAHLPSRKTLTDFNVDHQPHLKRDVLAYLSTAAFAAKADNVILLGTQALVKPTSPKASRSQLSRLATLPTSTPLPDGSNASNKHTPPPPWKQN